MLSGREEGRDTHSGAGEGWQGGEKGRRRRREKEIDMETEKMK